MLAEKREHAAPGLDLFLRVRAAFVARGTSLNRWCIEHKVQPTNARLCLTGAWDGPKGRRLRQRILVAAGLDR